MTSIKTFFATSLGILAALILAPFIAFFGLMMLGLSFGLALIAAATVTIATRRATPAQDAPAPEMDATAQPA